MFAEIKQDKVDQEMIPNDTGIRIEYIPGRYNRELIIAVDNEAAEVLKFFVSVLTGKDQAAKTDQGNVSGR